MFKNLSCLLNVSKLSHKKFAAVAHLPEGQFLWATENRVKFLILQEGTLRLILAITEGQNLKSRKNEEKEHQGDAL
jgi:hypothetical protein